MIMRENEWHKPKVIRCNDQSEDYREAICSVCGEILFCWYANEDKFGIISNYCPNCGARLLQYPQSRYIIVEQEERK